MVTDYIELNNHMDAVKEIYAEIGIDFTKESLEQDWKYNYLTLNECRNGRNVLWYKDSLYDLAIYVDTLVFLTDDEIEEQLC